MSKHKLRTVIEHGNPDLGAEIEVEIAFNHTRGRPAVMYLRNGDPGYPADPDEVEFISAAPLCNGKPAPFHGVFADLEQQWLNDMAEIWFYTDDGQTSAFEAVADDDERAQ